MTRWRSSRGAAVLVAVLAVGARGLAGAQEPVVEEQVALDDAGELLRVDADLARRLGLFGDLSNFREALLFRGPDGYVLEITRRRGGVLVRERTRLTEAQVAELRARVSEGLAQRAPAALLDRSGRALLLGTSTAAGLGFYGWAVPYALDIDDARGTLALYMLVASASFFGPWAWSGSEPVTTRMANGAFWGATRGIVHGIMLHRLVVGEQPEFLPCAPGDSSCFERTDERRADWSRGRAAVALAGSLVEGIGGVAVARATNASAGDAHLVGVASDFGALGALGLGVLSGLDGDDESALVGMSLAGAAAGLAGGAAFRARRDYSWGDTEVFRAAGLLGGYTGLVAAELVEPGERVYAAAGLAGGGLGLWLGDRLVRGREIAAGQGLLVDLGTVAGGLLGLGTAFLISDDAPDETLHLVLSSAGAWAGFGMTFGALADQTAAPPSVAPPSGRGAGESLRLELVPLPGAQRGGAGPAPPLALRLRYVF